VGLGVLVIVEIGKVTGTGAVVRMQPERTNAHAIASAATYAQQVFVMVSRTYRP